MQLVAPADARAVVRERGGRLYSGREACAVAAGGSGCSRRAPPRARDVRPVAAEGIELWATPRVGDPDEVHLELTRRGARALERHGLARALRVGLSDDPPLAFPPQLPIVRGMRHVPTWLKVVGALSLAAEAAAAALVFWHTGPRAR